MAALRERPSIQFNFLVDPGTVNANGAYSGFQEVSGIIGSLNLFKRLHQIATASRALCER